ncbi:hypothetical protein [Sphingosinicella ginsenosidimutans]|uniref:hypothetical protein n=1 Tax=Allosphingosinicella ginsenosidimutans TaxID=1176539 RepID=UPI00131579B0|nr:hypothetical protein [Sphingosinicella ginsenosidimutans]
MGRIGIRSGPLAGDLSHQAFGLSRLNRMRPVYRALMFQIGNVIGIGHAPAIR